MATPRSVGPRLSGVAPDAVVVPCREAHPDLQAIYVFGSRAGGSAHPGSDLDVAVLLPPQTAQQVGSLALSPLQQRLERALRVQVDLVNLRLAPTVFAKEIIAGSERIDSSDADAADAFEALTLSLYQELNVERAALLRDFERTGRAVGP